MIRLPAPPPRYDQRDQSDARRTIEQEHANTQAAVLAIEEGTGIKLVTATVTATTSTFVSVLTVAVTPHSRWVITGLLATRANHADGINVRWSVPSSVSGTRASYSFTSTGTTAYDTRTTETPATSINVNRVDNSAAEPGRVEFALVLVCGATGGAVTLDISANGAATSASALLGSSAVSVRVR